MVTPDEIRKMAAEQSFRERPILAEFLSDLAETVEALQADAERYRWLRNQSTSVEQFGSFSPYVVKGQTMEVLDDISLDAAIDCAMKKD